MMTAPEFDYEATTGYYRDIADIGQTEPTERITYTWTTGYIDNGEVDNHPVALALEFKGVLNIPHFVYRTANIAGSALKHTYWDAPNWIRETVQVSATNGGHGVGYATSIAIDRFGGPHIAFVNYRGNQIYAVQYVRREGSGWNVDTVGEVPGFPKRTGIALDANGIPHIAYTNPGRGGTIVHAVMLGSLWKREIVAAGIGTGDIVDIDIRAGVPHIAFYNETRKAIESVRLDGLNWNVDTIKPDVGNIDRQSGISTKFDSTGSPHICYIDASPGALEHARFAGTWQRDQISNSGQAAFPDIAIDRNNVPRVSYTSQGMLRYGERRNGAWQTLTVDQNNAQFSSIAVDLSGRPYIAYYDPQQADAMLAIGQPR